MIGKKEYISKYDPIPPEGVSAHRLQQQYCEHFELPMFAPTTGICWNCGRDIYSEDGTGYSKLAAMSIHITGCPYCSQSFCE